MSRLYQGQALKIELSLDIDITGAEEKKIKYIKPDGTEGSWDAEVVDAETGTIKKELAIEGIGDWVVWAYALIPEDQKLIGEPVKFTVYKEGT